MCRCVLCTAAIKANNSPAPSPTHVLVCCPVTLCRTAARLLETDRQRWLREETARQAAAAASNTPDDGKPREDWWASMVFVETKVSSAHWLADWLTGWLAVSEGACGMK